MTTAVITRPEDSALRALDVELDKRLAILEESAAAGITPKRLRAVVLSAFTRRPELWECDPVTIARAVVEAGMVGLEPTGAIGGAHLVPFFNKKSGRKEAQLILDYRGLVALARRSADISRVEARIVRREDQFEFAYGLEPVLVHVPALVEDPGPLSYCYAVAVFKSGERQFDVMSAVEVELIRRRSKAGEAGPWVTDYFEMAKKTVLRRLSKLLPLTIEARQVIELEDQADDEPVVTIRRPIRSLRAAFERPQALAEPTAEPAPEPEPAICGATPGALGDEEVCGLLAGHEGPHKSAEAVWPA